ncbi:hypothetical protein ACJJTC_016693, partial [Scirpophaga incertulas]
MFYPISSLKRGGRFHLCWVADSWPLRFSTVTHRQLWSVDIRKICDDLLKVTVLLSDLCMINANVIKSINKKRNIHDGDDENSASHFAKASSFIPEELAHEQGIEDIMQNRGNIVGNLQEITLREAVVPEIILPPNDNFGEEKSGSSSSIAQRSVSTIDNNCTLGVAEKVQHFYSFLVLYIPADIPEIPEVQLPDLPVPQPENVMEEQQVIPETSAVAPAQDKPVATTSPDTIQLEELEDQPQQKRRRLKNRLIIDKRIKLTGDYLVNRIGNPYIELRCEDSSEDIIDVRLPANILLQRPGHAGRRIYLTIGTPLTRLFQMNLGIVRSPVSDTEMANIHAKRTRTYHSRSVLERIEEEPRVEEDANITIQHAAVGMDVNQSGLNLDPNNPEQLEQVDVSEMLTQKILACDEVESRKRASQDDDLSMAKRQCISGSGYVTFRQSQQLAIDTAPIMESDKENLLGIAAAQKSRQTDVLAAIDTNIQPSSGTFNAVENSLAAMLEEAGLADLQNNTVQEQETAQESAVHSQRAVRRSEEGSETPLGSLDRTKVSLGDSNVTTDSKRFLR